MTTGILEIVRGRKREPDGRRNTISVKLSDAEIAEVRAAIGATLPGVWAREALLYTARMQQSPGGVPFAITLPEPCKHSKVRVKGTCPDCFTYVASKTP